MYERITDRARKVMQLANQEAQRFNHEYFGTEHILLGLVKEGSGTAASVLKNLEVDLRKIRLEVEKIVQSGPDMVTMGKLPQTPRAKKVVEYAMEEARNLNHNYLGTEHLLLGLIRELEGVAAQVLMHLGLKLEDVREEVLNLVGNGVEGTGDDLSERAALSQAGASQKSPKSKTPTLDNFGTDLTHLVNQGKIDSAIGRAKEIERVIQTLCRRQMNNPMLLGEAGVGKSAIIEGVAYTLVHGDVPELLRYRRIVRLDSAMLVARTNEAKQMILENRDSDVLSIEEHGGHAIRRLITQRLEIPLSEGLISGEFEGFNTITVNCQNVGDKACLRFELSNVDAEVDL